MTRVVRVRGTGESMGSRQMLGLIDGDDRPIGGVPVYSFAVPDDPITACPGDNGMRLFATAVTGMSQPVAPRMLWDAGYTIAWMWKYLRAGDSRHIVYGTERMPGDRRTYVEAARDVVRGLAS